MLFCRILRSIKFQPYYSLGSIDVDGVAQDRSRMAIILAEILAKLVLDDVSDQETDGYQTIG